MLPVIKRDPAMEIVPKGKPLHRGAPVTLQLNAVLQQISYAPTALNRRQGLQDLHRILSIDDSLGGLHNALIEKGTDRLLCWQLTCQLQERTVDDCMVLSILVCMELFWARSPYDLLKTSVLRLLDVLPWLLHAWQSFPDNHSLVEVIISILRTWCKLKEPRIKGRLISSGIVELVRKEVEKGFSRERRTNLALGLIKDLTFRSNASDKLNLFDNLKDVILANCRNMESTGVIESMSATLWNLASEPAMGRIMAEDCEIWSALRDLWSVSVETDKIFIHRNVSSTVGSIVASIAMDTSSVPVLIQQQTWLLPGLLDVLATQTDKDWRRRCMRTIRCLAQCDWGRAFLWKHVSSVEDLVTVLIQVLSSHRDDSDTRVQACQTLASILTFKGKDLALLGPCLETTLMQTLNDTRVDEKLVLAGSQTLLICLRHSPWKRASTFSMSLLERIQDTLDKKRDDAHYHEVFSDLLHQLLDEPPTSKKLSSFASTPVLDTLTILLEPVGPEFEHSRKIAVEIVKFLSMDSSCKKLLAGHETLLTTLVNICLISNGPLKEAAKSIVLELVPEL